MEFFAGIVRHRLEGMMAKRIDSPYLIGKRSSDWLKIKVTHTADFEVIGCVPTPGEKAVRALLLGEMDQGRLMYKGKFGSGLTRRQRQDFLAELTKAPKLQEPVDCPSGSICLLSGWRCRVRYFGLTEMGHLRSGQLPQTDHNLGRTGVIMDSKYLSAICAGFLCIGTANAVPATGIYHIPDSGAESRGGFQNIAVTNCAVCSPRNSQVVYGRQRGLAGIALEIVDEQIRQPVSVTFVPPAGIDIADRWQVHFNTTGDLGGMVSNKPLATTVRIESQYPSEEK